MDKKAEGGVRGAGRESVRAKMKQTNKDIKREAGCGATTANDHREATIARRL